MGNALRVKGELNAAIEQFTQALSIKPDFAEAHYNLGVALQEKDDFNAAIGSYEKACVINPSYIKAYVNMGNALKQKGDLDAALDRYKRAIKIKPDCAEGHYSIGVVLQEKSELNEAIDSYKRAIKFKPDYAEAHFNLGVIFQGRDDLDVSIENYKAAIEIKPNFGDAYSNIGIALQNKNELDAAVDIYKQALTVNPNHTESFINLEMLYFQLMETYKAHDQLSLIGNDKLNALLFEEPKHHIVQSIYYLLLGQTKASKAHLQGYKKLATSKKTKELTTNDQVFCSAYAKFLEHLIKKIPVYRSQDNRKIYHIGESHCLSYAHHNIMIKEKPFCISPVITFGAKSYHFSQETENTYKAITKRNLDCIPNESYIFISVGEIDCRAFGGLIQASEKSVSQLADIVHQTVRGYVTWFSKANLNKKHKYIFFNIPAPIYQKALSEDLNEKVALVVCLFNEELEEILKTTFFNLIDVYNATKDKSGFSNGLYHCDNAHLDSRILPLVQDEINKCDTF
jgi:tetratricopeptide (TPR) repeat protein